mmetsp:Transcript_46122/g.142083  ORF Transcript_46122/g.142083 Transcript_46122/m.142083 type:complete len:248 (-) Transcript_46122:759-1502(-)
MLRHTASPLRTNWPSRRASNVSHQKALSRHSGRYPRPSKNLLTRLYEHSGLSHATSPWRSFARMSCLNSSGNSRYRVGCRSDSRRSSGVSGNTHARFDPKKKTASSITSARSSSLYVWTSLLAEMNTVRGTVVMSAGRRSGDAGSSCDEGSNKVTSTYHVSPRRTRSPSRTGTAPSTTPAGSALPPPARPPPASPASLASCSSLSSSTSRRGNGNSASGPSTTKVWNSPFSPHGSAHGGKSRSSSSS